jgi:hypothetical protein
MVFRLIAKSDVRSGKRGPWANFPEGPNVICGPSARLRKIFRFERLRGLPNQTPIASERLDLQNDGHGGLASGTAEIPRHLLGLLRNLRI